MSLIALLLLGGVGVQDPVINKTFPESYVEPYLLLIRNGTVDTRIPKMLLDAGKTLEMESGEGFQTRRFVVKFDHPVDKTNLRSLEKNGIFVEGYIPNYAFLVSCDPEKITMAASETGIVWASPYEPGWKISPDILQAERYPDTLQIWLFGDADVSEIAENLETELDASIHSAHRGLNKTLLVSIDKSRINDLASLDAVRWIEPFYAPVFLNNQAQWVLQSWKEDERTLWDRGLDGTGIVASTGDAGLNTEHRMFKDSTIDITTWGDFPNHRKVIAYRPSAPGAVFGDDPSVDYHGTHTACSVCGKDSYWGGTSPYDGMAPGVKLYFVDVGNNASGIAYPSDYNDMYMLPWQGNSGGKAKVMSNSWGSGNPYRTYDLAARQTDEFTWNHPDFLIFYSAGNSSESGISPPSTAKDVVSVGATMNASAANIPANYSSVGPTSDGRNKPTITAPGALMSADGGSVDLYKFMEGTSMSSPAAAGASTLLVQYFREGWYPSGSKPFNSTGGVDPSAALLKALLINSTIADFANPIPDSKIGWGRICLDSVLYFEGNSKNLYVHDNTTGLETGDDACYQVDVTGGTWPLRATLVWTDPPAEMTASKQLVNDLNLYAESPSGTLIFGNVFQDGFSQGGGSKDATNVEECLRIKNPSSGIWKIHIEALNVPQGPQPYALVITGAMDPKEADLEGSGIRIDDSQNSSPNQALDPSDSAVIYPRLVNTGNLEASAVTAVISSPNPNLTVTDSTADYGSIKPGTVEEGSGFEVTLSQDAKKGDTLVFVVIAKIDDGSKIDTMIFHAIVGLSSVEEKETKVMPSLLCPSLLRNGSRILLELPVSQRVVLQMFDVTGRRVEVLANGAYNAGCYEFAIEDDMSSGVYFISLETDVSKQRIKTVRLGR